MPLDPRELELAKGCAVLLALLLCWYTLTIWR